MVLEEHALSMYTMKVRCYPTDAQKKVFEHMFWELEKIANIIIYKIQNKDLRFCNKGKNTDGKETFFPKDKLSTEARQCIISEALENNYSVYAQAWQNERFGLYNAIIRYYWVDDKEKGGFKKTKSASGKSKISLYPCDHIRTTTTKTGKVKEHSPYYGKKYKKRVTSLVSKVYPSSIKFTKDGTKATIHFSKLDDGNEYLKITLGKQNIRFGDNRDTIEKWLPTFDKGVYCTISKESDDKWYVIFHFGSSKNVNPYIYTYITAPDTKRDVVGIDVGEKDSIVTSYGEKSGNYQDIRGKKYYDKLQKHIEYLDAQLSTLWGPKNEKFRKARKEFSKKYSNKPYPPELMESNNYKKAVKKQSALKAKRKRQRDYFLHNATLQIVAGAELIGSETLDVDGMIDHEGDNKAQHAHNENLSNGSMSTIIGFLDYKAERYGRMRFSVPKTYPSTKTCSVCGFVWDKPLDTSIRGWVCPDCGAHHDRDINAAKNIEKEARKSVQ